MTEERPAVRVVVTFSGPNTADGQVSVEGQANVGQLALAGWLIEQQAEDARRAAMVAAARDQAQIVSLAERLQVGRRT